MHSTPNTKHRVAYFSRPQSQSKGKNDSNSSSVEKAKLVLGEETLGLYAHSNQGNLDYLASQIQLKKKEKQRTRRKAEQQQKRTGVIGEKQQGYSVDVDNTIVEIDASQEETQRSQQEASQVKNQIQRQLRMQQLRVPSLEEEILKNSTEFQASPQKQQQNPSFINFVDNYIEVLQQQTFSVHSPSNMTRKSRDLQRRLQHQMGPSPQSKQSKNNLSLKVSVNKSKFSNMLLKSKSKSKFRSGQYPLQQSYKQLQRKYERQVNHGPLLISQLQDYRRIQAQQNQDIMKLRERIQMAAKEVQRLKKLKQKHIKNRDLIRSVLMNQEIISKGSARAGYVGGSKGPRIRQQDSSIYQYETFKSGSQRQRR